MEVLIIEGDTNTMQILREQMLAAGHNPVCVSCAEDAQNELRKKKFDIVLTNMSSSGTSEADLTSHGNHATNVLRMDKSSSRRLAYVAG
jgi:DNA-binding NtrC family response regulator